jgi:hypothetical protein
MYYNKLFISSVMILLNLNYFVLAKECNVQDIITTPYFDYELFGHIYDKIDSSIISPSNLILKYTEHRGIFDNLIISINVTNRYYNKIKKVDILYLPPLEKDTISYLEGKFRGIVYNKLDKEKSTKPNKIKLKITINKKYLIKDETKKFGERFSSWVSSWFC